MTDKPPVELPRNPEGYADRGPYAYKERGLNSYKTMLFKHSLSWIDPKVNPMADSAKRFYEISRFTPIDGKGVKNQNIQYEWGVPKGNLFGGLDGFFSPNARILDLGSGHGKAVQEINAEYADKGIKCVGVDWRYHREQPDVTDNLVGAHFKALPFAKDEFDRIVSVESFPAWVPDDRNLVKQYFQEITRVSKEGTIWRGTLPTVDEATDIQPISMKDLVSEFCANGWEIIVHGSGFCFAAKLINKNEN